MSADDHESRSLVDSITEAFSRAKFGFNAPPVTAAPPAPPDLSWVELIQTLDAIDVFPVEAALSTPGWRLLGVGVGSGGQTTLTFGWPYPGSGADDRCHWCGAVSSGGET